MLLFNIVLQTILFTMCLLNYALRKESGWLVAALCSVTSIIMAFQLYGVMNGI